MTHTCGACGKPCKGVWRNEGIGPYEYHGQLCNDVRMEFMSECCDEPLEPEDADLEVDEPEEEDEWEE